MEDVSCHVLAPQAVEVWLKRVEGSLQRLATHALDFCIPSVEPGRLHGCITLQARVREMVAKEALERMPVATAPVGDKRSVGDAPSRKLAVAILLRLFMHGTLAL
jgi:hypothetical protein